MSDKQWNTMKKFFRFINMQQFCEQYYIHGSYNYLVAYLKGSHPRNKKMDAKLQTMILNYEEDMWHTIEELVKKDT